MKCDLHVHSIYSGMCSTPLLKSACRESYSQPEQVYAALKRKGMDLVTLTDHDSIEGAETLRRHRDCFVSEEVTCRMPSGTFAHIGVYDLTERQHVEIQRRRDDLAALLAYLSEARLFFAVNHVFSNLTGRRALEDFLWFEDYFPALEILNGQMLPFHNHQAKLWACRMGKAGIGGSDAHVLASVGSAYTDVPHVTGKAEFFHALRAGRGVAAGAHGSYFKLTRDILWIAAEIVQDKPSMAPLSPLAFLVPLATCGVLIREMVFARRWSRSVRESLRRRFGGGDARPTNGLEGVFAWP